MTVVTIAPLNTSVTFGAFMTVVTITLLNDSVTSVTVGAFMTIVTIMLLKDSVTFGTFTTITTEALVKLGSSPLPDYVLSQVGHRNTSDLVTYIIDRQPGNMAPSMLTTKLSDRKQLITLLRNPHSLNHYSNLDLHNLTINRPRLKSYFCTENKARDR